MQRVSGPLVQFEESKLVFNNGSTTTKSYHVTECSQGASLTLLMLQTISSAVVNIENTILGVNLPNKQ